MKKIIIWFFLVTIIYLNQASLLDKGGVGVDLVHAETDSRWLYGGTPMDVLDNVANEANQEYEIQETSLNNVTDQQWKYTSQYKISNTLDYIRNNIAPYLQRAVYIGLVVAVILIIYNGLLMVTNSIHKEWDIAKVKKNLMNIMIGVLLLTWFYAIVKIVIGLINSIFGNSNGSSGF